MLTEECNEIHALLVKSLNDYEDVIEIAHMNYYIYIFNHDKKLITIIHGYGTATEPYNVKFMTKSRHERDFHTIEQFKKYLANEFIGDLTASYL